MNLGEHSGVQDSPQYQLNESEVAIHVATGPKAPYFDEERRAQYPIYRACAEKIIRQRLVT
jgi:hypothetical protein